MSDQTIALLQTAFNAYLVHLQGNSLEPSLSDCLPYDFYSVRDLDWRMPLPGEMVVDELRELTNKLHDWHSALRKWQAWNLVIEGYEVEPAWELRREFLEALAHQCLLRPSSIRDTFTFVATNSFHQVRLASDANYRDVLDGDPKTPSDRPHLTRTKKEARLSKLIADWSGAADFMDSLRQINDRDYQTKTSDYRNRNSHAIGPRLGIGITQSVVRSVIPATEMVEQPDRTWRPTPIHGKMAVSYGFGGTAPLDMEEARAANLEQYQRARICYASYRQLLASRLPPPL